MFFNALTKFVGNCRWSGSRHADSHGATSLRLCLQGRQLHFASPRDFAFSLVGRSAVPSHRLSFETGASVAVREAEWQLLDRDIRTLSAMFAAPCLAGALAAHGTHSFVTDHEWRALFVALLAQRRARGAYLELALGAYIDFLRACQQVLRLSMEVPSMEAPVDVPWDTATPPPPALRRLPHGQAVSLRLEQGREVTIALARHRFALRHDQEWTLVTDGGHRYVLRDGINTIGRGRSSSITIDNALRNVSRTHLLLEPVGRDVVKLTDLSQEGTFIPPTAQAS